MSIFVNRHFNFFQKNIAFNESRIYNGGRKDVIHMANMTVATRIKDRRNELGWSQRELASKMGYASNTTVAKIEQGKVDVSQDRLEQFAQVLGVSVAYLIGYEQIQKKNDQLVKLVTRLRREERFAEAVKMLDELDADKFDNVFQILSAFTQK